ncbi:MAG: GlsB/YeaQ/YmgE family stress response membrane protein [Salinarimonas sp.]
MSIIAWIVVGIIAGFIAEKITGRDHGLLTNLIVGIIGAFVGGFLASLLGFEFREGFNIASIVVATIGAIVFLWILGLIKGRRTR